MNVLHTAFHVLHIHIPPVYLWPHLLTYFAPPCPYPHTIGRAGFYAGVHGMLCARIFRSSALGWAGWWGTRLGRDGGARGQESNLCLFKHPVLMALRLIPWL